MKMKNKHKEMCLSDRVLIIFAHVFVIFTAIACTIPFYLMIINSIADSNDIIRFGYKFIPKRVTFLAYELILGHNSRVYRAYLNSIMVTVFGTTASMLIISCLAYGLSVKTVKYRERISFFIYLTMLFNGGITPTYILVCSILHLGNSLAALVIPSLINTFYMFLMRNFFRSIPDSLSESAKIDGANDVYILFKIVLPLSLPAIATISLFYCLDYWNQWVQAALYIDDTQKYPLQYLIQSIVNNISAAQQMVAVPGRTQAELPSYTIRLATALVTVGPVILVYPFAQKYFVRGVMVGAIKG